MKRFAAWLFKAPILPTSSWRVIVWWELRRIPFNISIGTFGLICTLFYYAAMDRFGRQSDQKQILDMAVLLIAPFTVNALYTLGWLIEIPTRLVLPNLKASFAPSLLKWGMCLILFPIILGTLFWMGYPLFHNLGWIG